MEHKCNSCFYMFNKRDQYPCNTCEGYNKYVNRNVYIHKSDTEEMIDWVDEETTFDEWESDQYMHTKEAVNSPKHYTSGKYEVIDVIEDWDLNFRLANTVKYIARHKHKGKPLEDLEKALWYLQREVDKWKSHSQS
jgi:hypothetical protein